MTHDVITDVTPAQFITTFKAFIIAYDALERRHETTVQQLSNDVAQLKQLMTKPAVPYDRSAWLSFINAETKSMPSLGAAKWWNL